MKKYLLILTSVVLLVACSAKQTKQVIRAVNYDELKSIVQKNDDVLYVVNFWATWCGPCVEELPSFMEVNDQLKNKDNYKMILVSLDNVDDLETHVRHFVTKRDISPDIYLLDDNKRMNIWIPDIDPNWSGNIPATVFYKNGKKLFFIDGQIDKETLKKTIQQFI
jgi:thiol-disulfide isomerase/thioredoxin